MFVGVQAFKDRVVQFARTWGHVLRLEFPHGGGGGGGDTEHNWEWNDLG